MKKVLEKQEMLSLARRGVFTRTTKHKAIIDYFYEALPRYANQHGSVMKARRETALTFDVSPETVKKLAQKHMKR